MKKYFFIIVCGIFISSCGEYEKILKSNDNKLKYKKALSYFNEKKYGKSEKLLENLIPIYRGTSKDQTLRYYHAFCKYEQGLYRESSYFFNRFVEIYPNSNYAEECLFMSALSDYKISPDPKLDQSSTLKAVESFQVYINRYPDSKRIEVAEKYIDELDDKLAYKAYLSAKNYFDRELYRASIISLQNVIKDFPLSIHRENILFMLLKSRYEFALNSIQEKKIDRYNEAKEEYITFMNEYPESEFKEKAQKLSESIDEFLNKIDLTQE